MVEPSAVVADDEPHLRQHLTQLLQTVWPELELVGQARNGEEALALIERRRPTVAFLDIRMPVLSGLEVAEQLPRPCQVVFVTAYDRFAVDAFERGAVDYLLKPISEERLSTTARRLRKRITEGGEVPRMIEVVRHLLGQQQRSATAYLRWIKALEGQTIRLIPIEEVHYFQVADKYTVVHTGHSEAIIRTPLRELRDQLDPGQFWQIHRATIVNATRIERVERDFRGRHLVVLKGRREPLVASRSHAHIFKQM
jgi:DNA-binding LytR/AlgR family response regulator